MKITHKIISIPPYISTSWSNVQALHMQDTMLVVTLFDAESVYVPDLRTEEIEEIFHAHRAFLEQEEKEEKESGSSKKSRSSQSLGSAFSGVSLNSDDFSQLGIGGIEGFSSMLQHNPAQAHAPNLPAEMLEKVASVAKMMGPQETSMMPSAEPHCNCMYCQIARAISQAVDDTPAEEDVEDPEISADDLHFQEWDIKQTGDKLYQVTHRLDSDERYSVYLGEPVGCTCGRSGCEHIVAVLQS